MRALLRIKIRPYYLFHCDPVTGPGHFRTSVWKGLEIMEGLRGHMSGLGIPTYVVDSPHGGGKIPLMPNYLVSASDDCVVLRNYEGMLVRYQAEDKPRHVSRPSRAASARLLTGTAVGPDARKTTSAWPAVAVIAKPGVQVPEIAIDAAMPTTGAKRCRHRTSGKVSGGDLPSWNDERGCGTVKIDNRDGRAEAASFTPRVGMATLGR